MKVEDFLEIHAGNYVESYLDFKEASISNDRDKYFSSINHISNCCVFLIKHELGGDYNKTFSNLIYDLQAYDPKFDTTGLNLIRGIRNTYTHDVDNTYDVISLVKVITLYYFNTFISYYAKEFKREAVDSFSSEDFQLILKHDEDQEYDPLVYYNNHVKENIHPFMVGYFEPFKKSTDLSLMDARIIYDYIFENNGYENIKDKYNVSGEKVNNILKEFGFNYDFVEIVRQFIGEFDIFSQFIEDFYDKRTEKYKILRRIVDLTKKGDDDCE